MDRRAVRLALALTLLPLFAAGVALVLTVRGEYFPAADYAWTEMHVRDVGRHEVLTGLYSRGKWSHPGPLLFYLLAPFYWLTGGSSIGLHLGALAINGAAITGMALIARRRGGTPLLLCTLLGCALLLRTAGAQFAQDPWNLFVTTLPFGLMIFLTWSMTCGERWALPVTMFVGSFLAQTHVQFTFPVLLLGTWGAGWLVLCALRSGDRVERLRLLRSGGMSLAVLALVWLPVALDVLRNNPSNLRSMASWYRHSGEKPHGLGDSWRVASSQFGLPPEWLTSKKSPGFGGISPFLHGPVFPWLLVPIALAAIVLWRREQSAGRRLVVTLALALVASVIVVMRTLGPIFDYRMRSTWIVAMVALVASVWTAWRAAERSPRTAALSRAFVPLALAALVVVNGVNGLTAATAGTPHAGNSTVVGTITDQVLDSLADAELADREGVVLIDTPFGQAEWFASGLYLQLERNGVDVAGVSGFGPIGGRHRVHTDEPVRAHLLVGMDDQVETLDRNPNLRRVASWEASSADEHDAAQQRLAELDAEWRAGRLSDDDLRALIAQLASTDSDEDGIGAAKQSIFTTAAPMAFKVAVFVDTR